MPYQGEVAMLFLTKLWCSLNYRYCKASEYLAHQRGDGPESAEFGSLAMDWQREYLMTGSKLT